MTGQNFGVFGRVRKQKSVKQEAKRCQSMVGRPAVDQDQVAVSIAGFEPD